MPRLTLFAKGNSDLRDSLLFFGSGDHRLWNGINEVVRPRFPGWTIRVRHETWTRSDALLLAGGVPPHDPPPPAAPASHAPEAQFSRALFETEADAILLSIQPDVTMRLARHAGDGYLFYPGPRGDWTPATLRRLREEFTDLDLLTPAESARNLRQVIARIRRRSASPILVYNLSPVMPGEWVHTHQGLEDTLATRIRRFNLELVELSRETGVSIVDVETVVARHGADRLKLDAVRLNADGARLVAEEVARILDDLGLFRPAERAGCG